MTIMNRFLTGSTVGIGFQLLKAMVNLILIPILLSQVGPDLYGLFALLVGFTELAFLMDMGFSSALTKELSQLDGKTDRIQQVLTIGHGVYIALTVLALVVGFGCLPWFNTLFHISGAIADSARDATFYAVCIIAIYIYSSYYRAILLSQALHQWSHMADGIHHILGNGLGILLLYQGWGLPGFFMARLLSAILMLVFVMIQSTRMPFNVYRWVKTRWTVAQSLVSMSGYSAISQISILLSHRLDAIVIGLFLPLSAVGIYEMVFRFLGVTPKIMGRISQGALPVLTRLVKANTEENAAETLPSFFVQFSTFLTLSTLLPMALIGVNFDVLLDFFAANTYTLPQALPALLFGIPMVFTGIYQGPACYYLMAKGEFRYLAISSLITALINVIVSVLLVQWLGIVGVILGTLIPQGIQHQVYIIAKSCRMIGLSYTEYIKTSLLKPVMYIGLLCLIAGVIKSWLAQLGQLNIVTLTGYCGMLTVGGVGVYYQFFGNPTEKAFLKKVLGRLHNRTGVPAHELS